jgi:ArsR family transcriptional regulator
VSRNARLIDGPPIILFNGHMAMKVRPKYDRRRYAARAKIAKAMAHPSRLLMLEAMEGKERCVCELTELVGADQSTVSKHLAVLKHAGLVEDRKEGVMVYYRVKVCCLQGFWDCIENVLAENLKVQQAALR